MCHQLVLREISTVPQNFCLTSVGGFQGMEREEDNWHILWSWESNLQPLCFGSRGHVQDPDREKQRLNFSASSSSSCGRSDPAGWARQQDSRTQQGVPSGGAAAPVVAVAAGQPLVAQAAAGPAVPHGQAAGAQQDVGLQPGPHVRPACPLAQTRKAHQWSWPWNCAHSLRSFFNLPDLWCRWRPPTWRTTWRSSTTPRLSSSSTPRSSLGWLFCCTLARAHTSESNCLLLCVLQAPLYLREYAQHHFNNTVKSKVSCHSQLMESYFPSWQEVILLLQKPNVLRCLGYVIGLGDFEKSILILKKNVLIDR